MCRPYATKRTTKSFYITKDGILNDARIRGDWSQTVARTLRDLVDNPPVGNRPPIAAFDWDNTCIYNDIGEATYFHLTNTLNYHFDSDDFWTLIPTNLDRDDLRSLWTQIRETRDAHPLYPDFRYRIARLYLDAIDAMGHRDAYAWAAQIHVGMTPEWVLAEAERVMRREMATPLGETVWTDSKGGSLTLASGIRLFQPIADLMDALRGAGWEVCVATASPRLAVVPFAALLGVPAGRVIGMTNRMENGRLVGELLPPVTYRGGKVEAIVNTFGYPPLLAVGDAWTDAEMLDAARDAGGVGLLLDRGDAELRAHAESVGWLVQSRWSHGES